VRNSAKLRAALEAARKYLNEQYKTCGDYDLARRTGAARTTIRLQYESGWNGNPDRLADWCEALETSEANPQPVGYPAGRKRGAK
jgi:hypothetical protein